jgi:hypothetical protein
MIPASLSFAGDAAGLQPGDSQPEPGFSMVPGSGGHDFPSLISQALNQSPTKPIADNNQYQAPDPAGDADALTQSFLADANPVGSPSQGTVEDGAQKTDDSEHNQGGKTSHRKSGVTIDPAVDNNLVALLGVSLVPVSKPDVQTPARITGKASAVGQEGTLTSTPDVNTHNSPGSTREALSNTVSRPSRSQELMHTSDSVVLTAKTSLPTATETAASVVTASNRFTPVAQVLVPQTGALLENSTKAAIPLDGTGTAGNNPQMKSTGQKNETAGRTVQKLPRAPSSGESAANSRSTPAREIVTAGSARKSEAGSLPSMIDITTPSATGNLGGGTVLDNSPNAPVASAQVERIAQLVTQEVVMVKLSGATSLAVSLKVDPQTELFVQLTSHNGQIQASLRCERGNFADLNSHWGQLQESLARQNVQLLPPTDRNFSRNSAGTPSDTPESGNFRQSSQNAQQQNRDLRTAAAPVQQSVKTAGSRRAKNKTSSGEGWESWA